MRQKWTDDELAVAIQESRTFVEVLERLGLSTNSNRSRDRIRARTKELGLDWSHFKRQGLQRPDEFNPFVYGILFNTTTKRYFMKQAKYECALCGISDWLGKELILQVDHIDGDRRNNTLDNLRLLCPNCHSQTETWSKKKSALEKLCQDP